MSRQIPKETEDVLGPVFRLVGLIAQPGTTIRTITTAAASEARSMKQVPWDSMWYTHQPENINETLARHRN